MTNRNNSDRAAEMFGAPAEREEFQRAARNRTDAPQTAPMTVLTTFVPTITITICASC